MMKVLITIFGLIAFGVGVADLVSPEILLTIGRDVLTPAGLYVIAFVRVGLGLLLLGAAKTSRMPRAVRILGAVVLISGIATPIFGLQRSLSVLNWWAAQDPLVTRFAGLLLVTLATLMIYATRPVRRRATG